MPNQAPSNESGHDELDENNENSSSNPVDNLHRDHRMCESGGAARFAF